MFDPRSTKKNCLQWGLRILPPKVYHGLLERYAKELAKDSYDRIRVAHYDDNNRFWQWKWLCCEILEEGKWFNIATGCWIDERPTERVATFESWSDYERFREALRKATGKYFQSNSFHRREP